LLSRENRLTTGQVIFADGGTDALRMTRQGDGVIDTPIWIKDLMAGK
jgi:hypothetical protein